MEFLAGVYGTINSFVMGSWPGALLIGLAATILDRIIERRSNRSPIRNRLFLAVVAIVFFGIYAVLHGENKGVESATIGPQQDAYIYSIGLSEATLKEVRLENEFQETKEALRYMENEVGLVRKALQEMSSNDIDKSSVLKWLLSGRINVAEDYLNRRISTLWRSDADSALRISELLLHIQNAHLHREGASNTRQLIVALNQNISFENQLLSSQVTGFEDVNNLQSENEIIETGVDQVGLPIIPPVTGCTNPAALNFNPAAVFSATTPCIYPPGPDIIGCRDSEATNYDASATISDRQSCIYDQ